MKRKPSIKEIQKALEDSNRITQNGKLALCVLPENAREIFNKSTDDFIGTLNQASPKSGEIILGMLIDGIFGKSTTLTIIVEDE